MDRARQRTADVQKGRLRPFLMHAMHDDRAMRD